MSKLWPLYWKKNQYTYTDLDMKFLIAVIYALVNELEGS